MAINSVYNYRPAQSQLVATVCNRQIMASKSNVPVFVKSVSEKVARLGRRALGIRDPKHKFLLLGETGSGKTSFLNLLHNCGKVEELGKEGLEQCKDFNDISLEDPSAKKMQSKTSGAKLYDVTLGDLQVGIIDTPGFGDSRGFEQDRKNVKKIIEVLNEEDYINCVCLVINGRQSRMSASLSYALSEITAILPKEILNNVIVVFSNTDDVLNLNFEPEALVDYFGGELEHLFYIENPYCKLDKAKAKVGKLPLGRIRDSLHRSFKETSEELKRVSETIKDFKPVHTESFNVLYEKKKLIERNVLTLVTAYDNQVRLEEFLDKAKEDVSEAVRRKRLNADFTTTREFERTVVDLTKKHNTLCGVANCYSNCHKECTLAKSMDKEQVRRCLCFGQDRVDRDVCEVCHHSYTQHYYDEVLFRKEVVVENLVDEGMRQQFMEAESSAEQLRIIHARLQSEKQVSENERLRISKELLITITKFETLAVHRSYKKLIENQIAVINTRIEASIGPETEHLRKTRDELAKKLDIVEAAPQDFLNL